MLGRMLQHCASVPFNEQTDAQAIDVIGVVLCVQLATGSNAAVPVAAVPVLATPLSLHLCIVSSVHHLGGDDASRWRPVHVTYTMNQGFEQRGRGGDVCSRSDALLCINPDMPCDFFAAALWHPSAPHTVLRSAKGRWPACLMEGCSWASATAEYPTVMWAVVRSHRLAVVFVLPYF